MSKLVITKRTLILCLILALLIAVQTSRWIVIGHEYYAYASYKEPVYSVEPIMLDVLSSHFGTTSDYSHEMSMRYYYKDLITGQQKNVFYGSVDYYGHGTSYGASGGITGYSNPILIHATSILIYLMMGIIGIMLLIGKKKYSTGIEPTFSALFFTVMIAVVLSFILNYYSVPILTTIIVVLFSVASLLLLLFQNPHVLNNASES